MSETGGSGRGLALDKLAPPASLIHAQGRHLARSLCPAPSTAPPSLHTCKLEAAKGATTCSPPSLCLVCPIGIMHACRRWKQQSGAILGTPVSGIWRRKLVRWSMRVHRQTSSSASVHAPVHPCDSTFTTCLPHRQGPCISRCPANPLLGSHPAAPCASALQSCRARTGCPHALLTALPSAQQRQLQPQRGAGTGGAVGAHQRGASRELSTMPQCSAAAAGVGTWGATEGTAC